MSSLEQKKQYYFQAISQLENWTYFVSHLGKQFESFQKFAIFFQNSLKRRGFDEAIPQIKLDTLILGSYLREDQLKDVLAQVDQHSHEMIGLQLGETLQMGSSAEPLNLQSIGSVKAIQAIYFHCGIPKLQDMLALSHKVEKLIFINSCGQVQLRFDGLFNYGIESFARQNPDVKFAEFHLPSLVLAVQKLKGQNPIELLAKNKMDSLEPIGWASPQFDDNVGAYRAKSAVEAIDWYRL
jgi:hypothetical protein